MCDLAVQVEMAELEAGDSRAVLFMATVATSGTSQPHQTVASRSLSGSTRSHAPPLAGGGRGTSSLSELTPTFMTAAQPVDVCHLEGCGLGWRVRPPLQRRGPWTVVAQRIRLSVEAICGAKIEKVYTLYEYHELSHRMNYEVSIGDLHAGDVCHVPVLIWLPRLHAPISKMEVIRFSLTYVDAVKIETRSCDVCASISRPAVSSPVCATKSDCDRNHLQVAGM